MCLLRRNAFVFSRTLLLGYWLYAAFIRTVRILQAIDVILKLPTEHFVPHVWQVTPTGPCA